MNINLPWHKSLKNGTKVNLDRMRLSEQNAVRALLNQIIIEDQTYPQNQPLSEVEFAAYWMTHDAFVVTADDETAATPEEILGAFYLKPNFPGRCSHICNAGFIVQPSMRGQGIGRLMGQGMLEIATLQGYTAVMFNLVFANNTPSIQLWESLGFQIIGRIPSAAHLSDGRVVDTLMMYRPLVIRH
jgi:L-amino acid N-acyltransferase YncA